MNIASLTRYKLGGEGRRAVQGCPGFYMRIDDDVRKCVVFFGFADDTKQSGIQCVGTGFCLSYGVGGYLITARHVADGLGEFPFLVRVNAIDGTAKNIEANVGSTNVKWYFHSDPTVDVAVLPFHAGQKSGFDTLYLPEEMIADDRQVQNDSTKMLGSFGPGDITYTVGLFQFLSGTKRNLPVVHKGSIAAVPRDEKIPVTDWREEKKTIFVEGYLVETQALKGLSGSPVFVRRTLHTPTVPHHLMADERFNSPMFMMATPQKFIHLLGVWQSSWDAPPDDVVAIISGKNVRVPVGMGIVAPAQKIVEILLHPELQEMRESLKRSIDEHLATATPD